MTDFRKVGFRNIVRSARGHPPIDLQRRLSNPTDSRRRREAAALSNTSRLLELSQLSQFFRFEQDSR
jgi:hypothetical protein